MLGKLELQFDLESAPRGNSRAIENNTVGHDMFETGSSTFKNRRNVRTSVANSYSDIEFVDPVNSPRRSRGPKVNYVKSVKKSTRSRTRSASSAVKFEWTWMKLGWLMCFALVVRLFMMEGGVADYYSMDQALIEKNKELDSLRLENAELVKEIHKIRTSPQYQKQLAREHLGVIAKDEYLVLFSKDH